MKNLIYYNRNKCDVYFRKKSNKNVRANKTEIYIEDINKYNVKDSVVTFNVKDFLIKSLDMPLDNYIHDRVINSLKFYFNSSEEEVLYDYFLLDSNMDSVKILLYAIKVGSDVKNILKYIDKSYLVVRPFQFIMLEYLTCKYSIKSGMFLNNNYNGEYNFIVFKNGLILVNEYMDAHCLDTLDEYVLNKLKEVKEEFNVDINKEVYFLNDIKNKHKYGYEFKFDYIDYTMEEVLSEHNYIKSKFSKLFKKREGYRKNA